LADGYRRKIAVGLGSVRCKKPIAMENTMTLKLLIFAAALLAVSACVVRPYGESPVYYGSGYSAGGYNGGDSRGRDFDNRDDGDRGQRGGIEGHQRRDER
jgi:hypothetical protein